MRLHWTVDWSPIFPGRGSHFSTKRKECDLTSKHFTDKGFAEGEFRKMVEDVSRGHFDKSIETWLQVSNSCFYGSITKNLDSHDKYDNEDNSKRCRKSSSRKNKMLSSSKGKIPSNSWPSLLLEEKRNPYNYNETSENFDYSGKQIPFQKSVSNLEDAQDEFPLMPLGILNCSPKRLRKVRTPCQGNPYSYHMHFEEPDLDYAASPTKFSGRGEAVHYDNTGTFGTPSLEEEDVGSWKVKKRRRVNDATAKRYKETYHSPVKFARMQAKKSRPLESDSSEGFSSLV